MNYAELVSVAGELIKRILALKRITVKKGMRIKLIFIYMVTFIFIFCSF